MRYRLEVRNEAGDIETVVEVQTVTELESHLGEFEKKELGITTKEYFFKELQKTQKFYHTQECYNAYMEKAEKEGRVFDITP